MQFNGPFYFSNDSIATEVTKQTFSNFEKAINNCHKSIEQLNEKVQNASKNITETSHKAFKKKALTFTLILSITILGSTLLTYYIMQLFPTKVSIDTKGDITIDGGNISIWGTGKNSVRTGKKG